MTRAIRRTTVIACVAIAAACAQDDPNQIEGVGTLELVEVDIGPSITARVERVLVSEGDHVAVGDTLAVFTIPTLDAELSTALAEHGVARATLDELQAGADRRDIERAEAILAERIADLARFADDSARIAPLVPKALASEAQLVAARNATLSAAAARDAALATLNQLRDGTRPERIAAARAQLDRTAAGIATTRAVAHELVIRSTVNGVVVTRSAEPGEVVSATRPVVTIAETRRPWVRVYVGPQHLSLVNTGDTATAILDAFPDRAFTGRVTAIATRAEYTPRVALTERERADLLFGVRVDFADTTGMLKAGLPVTVRFHARATQ